MYDAILRLRRYLLFLVMSLASNQVLALSFKPTEAEWLTWGEMCQARYVVSGAGINSVFELRVSQGTVDRWKNKVGSKAWYGLHHYCAGLIIDNRRGNPAGAIPEYLYAFRRTPKSDPLYSVIGSKIALAYYKTNNMKNAKLYVMQIINSNPNLADGYLIKGIIERKDGELKKAIQTLELGNSKTEGVSAELNYHLGLNYFTLGNYKEANKYAKIAYNLGYPLPWLRVQLIKDGHWH